MPGLLFSSLFGNYLSQDSLSFAKVENNDVFNGLRHIRDSDFLHDSVDSADDHQGVFDFVPFFECHFYTFLISRVFYSGADTSNHIPMTAVFGDDLVTLRPLTTRYVKHT